MLKSEYYIVIFSLAARNPGIASNGFQAQE